MSANRTLERSFFSMGAQMAQVVLAALKGRFALIARQLFWHGEDKVSWALVRHGAMEGEYQSGAGT